MNKARRMGRSGTRDICNAALRCTTLTGPLPGSPSLRLCYSGGVYLIDMSGEVVHKWDTPGQPGNYAKLQPNGNLLIVTEWGAGPEGLPARGGLIQEMDWGGRVVWEHRDEMQHHDFHCLANGNLMYLSWKLMPGDAAAKVQGGEPGSEHSAGGIWGDYLREVTADGEPVWDWRIWEHLTVENYPQAHTCARREFGHANTIVPIGEDHVGICCRRLDWVAVIEMQTGDLVYERRDADWGGPHDFQPLDNGNYLVFANRNAQVPRGSKVIEWNSDTDETLREYWGNPTITLESHFISGCHRLWSGNTLICEGSWGRFFEVTKDGDIVWENISPYCAYDDTSPVRGDQSTVFRAYR